MSYTINPNAKNKWARNAENTMDLSLETDASSVYLDNGRTLEQEIGEGSMVSNVVTIDSAMSKVIDGTLDGAYENCLLKGRTLVNVLGSCKFSLAKTEEGKSVTRYIPLNVLIKPNTKYLYVINVLKNTLTRSDNGSVMKYCETDSSKVSSSTCWGLMNHIYPGFTGVKKHIMTTKPVFEGVCELSDRIEIYGSTDVGGVIEFETFVIEYQDGMENWDIPYFEGLCDVKMPTLHTVGKNLFDGDNSMELGAWKSNATHFETSSEIRCKNNFIPFPNGLKNGDVMRIVLSDTSISSNTNMHVYDASKTHIVTLGYGASPYIEGTNFINGVSTITIHDVSKCKYFSFRAVSTNTECKFAIMVNTSAPYEDYKSNILRTPKTVTLRSLPNGVRDELNLKTGEYIKRIGEIVLNGSEEWLDFDTVTNAKRFRHKPLANTKEAGTIVCISDKLPTYLRVETGQVISSYTEHVGIEINNQELWIYTEETKNMTTSNFKAWLQQNPITVQYQLARPITTIVEPLTIPFAYENGHIILESGSEEQSLLPTLEYSTVVNKTGQVESVAKTIQKQEKQLTMLEQMLIQNIINLDYNNTLLTLKNEMEEMF